MPRSHTQAVLVKRMQMLLLCGMLMKFDGATWARLMRQLPRRRILGWGWEEEMLANADLPGKLQAYLLSPMIDASTQDLVQSPGDRHVYMWSAAFQVMVECRLAEETECLNRERGVAPGYSQLVELRRSTTASLLQLVPA